MKLVHAERLGEAFDSQLVIGVRESYGKTRGEGGAPSLLIQFVKPMNGGFKSALEEKIK